MSFQNDSRMSFWTERLIRISFLIGDLGLVRPENPHFRAVGLSGGFLRSVSPIV